MVKVNLEIPTGFTGVFADQHRLTSFVNSDLKALGFVMKFPADVNIGSVGTHGETGDQCPFQQFMGIVTDNFTVFAGAGLTFIGIDDEVMRASVRFPRHEGPFHAGRETCAATSAQS